ncbi:ribosomal protein S18-alanine N-acetyltransferase [Microbacterium sp. YY-01]|uniref:ribosomal protein S18-alanine N-acetyltransferase n=1 Tax=Microbacterium sp. YY-01 TaxID=3421634 RepID=UPI003D17F528
MIRTATPHDLDGIMVLEQRCFIDDAWQRDTMHAELASPHNHYIVDDIDGTICGYAGLRALAGARDSDIQTIALDPDMRGTGRGRAMLRHLLREAIQRGAHETFLDVRADNTPAISLYTSEGFTEIGRRPRYYRPDGTDAIVMRLGLHHWAQPKEPQL